MQSRTLVTGTALLVVVLHFGPEAAASVEDENELRFADGAGDVSVAVRVNDFQAPPASLPSDDFGHIDIREVWLGAETASTFDVGVKFAKWAAPNRSPLPGGRLVDWRLAHGNAKYEVSIPGNAACDAFVKIWDEGPQHYRPVGCAKKTDEPSSQAMLVTVPKALVVNENGIPFGHSRSLDHVQVIATDLRDSYSSPSFFSYKTNVTDRAPDAGTRGPFVGRLQSGVGQSDLHLSSKEPIRASNGESTTIVFPVSLVNEGRSERIVTFTVETTEPEFGVRVPVRMRAPPGKPSEFPVILSMGFAHRHGELGTFDVVAEDVEDPRQATAIRLGVYWLPVPQPSGHHNKLWLHSAPGDSRPAWTTQRTWMNTQQTDPNAGTTDEGVFGGGTLSYGQASWWFQLSPPLRLGLAFDLHQSGKFRAAIQTTAPMSSAILNATLALSCRPSDHPLCPSSGPMTISSGQSSAQSLGPNSETVIEISMATHAPLAAIPHLPNSTLALQVRLYTVDAYAHIGPYGSPLILPKKSLLTLPLVEYHDPVAQEYQAAGTIALAVRGASERKVNAGEAVVFPVRVENKARGEDTIKLQLVGYNSDWTTLRGATSIKVPGGATHEFLVGVNPPADAGPGERAEFFVIAESSFDWNVVAMTRLRAAVVVEDVEDESALLALDPQGRSPSIENGLLALILVGVVVDMRRRTKDGRVPARQQAVT